MSLVVARCIRCFLLIGFVVLLSVIFIPYTVSAGQVSLAWDQNTETDIAGYRIHYGLTSLNYDQVVDVGNTTTCTISGLQDGETYYFAATDYNTEGMESGFSNEVSATISTANQQPVANAGPDQTVDEGARVTLSGTNSVDPNGDALSYSWSQISGTSVTLSDSSAAQTTFVAPNLGPNGGTLAFQLTVANSSASQASDTCLVNVIGVNQAPTANAGPDQTVSSGQVVTLDGSGSLDPDGLPLTYQWTQTSGTSVVLSSTSVAQPSFLAPSVDKQGVTLMFQLMVTDSGGLQARALCVVNVTWVNQPPIANAGPNQTVNQGSTVTLNGTGSSDPDGETVSYFWLQTSGTPVTLSDATSAQPTFVAPTGTRNSTLVFSLTVTDPQGLTSSSQCSVVVKKITSQITSQSTRHSFGHSRR